MTGIPGYMEYRATCTAAEHTLLWLFCTHVNAAAPIFFKSQSCHNVSDPPSLSYLYASPVVHFPASELLLLGKLCGHHVRGSVFCLSCRSWLSYVKRFTYQIATSNLIPHKWSDYTKHNSLRMLFYEFWFDRFVMLIISNHRYKHTAWINLHSSELRIIYWSAAPRQVSLFKLGLFMRGTRKRGRIFGGKLFPDNDFHLSKCYLWSHSSSSDKCRAWNRVNFPIRGRATSLQTRLQLG